MTDYKAIFGKKIKFQTSDLTMSSATEGELFYSSSGTDFKVGVNIEAWASGGNLPTATKNIRGCGLQTAALSFGGATPPGPPYAVVETYEYDGSSWTDGGDLSQNNESMGTAGTQTAGLGFGGDPSNKTHTYDGSTWADLPATLTTTVARRHYGSMGTQTEAIACGTPNSASTEEYTLAVTVRTADTS